MNTTINLSVLTPCERQVAELYVWGLTVKEIAQRLCKSGSTVKNQLCSVFYKTGVRKDTELAAWFFCSRFNISFDLSPLTRTLVSITFLLVMGFSMIQEVPMYRVRTRIELKEKKDENENTRI